MGISLLSFPLTALLPLSAILLSYQVVLGTGAQSITAGRDIRYSNNLDKHEAVRQ